MHSATGPQTGAPLLATRPAVPALKGWVGVLWAGTADLPGEASSRERVLPTGHMHVVFRLAGPRLSLYTSAEDCTGRAVGHCIVGGSRDVAYLRALDREAWSVGAVLRPGAARALLGVPADALAGAHWCLEDFWGAEAARLRERLLGACDPGEQLGLLEQELLRRLRGARELHPAVALGIARLRAGSEVGTVVRESGVSHRRFITLFRDAVGLTPKAWARVLRFRRALAELAADARPAHAAAAADYFDQPHFNREFRRITGLTPAEYRRIRPVNPSHVPMAR
jgi:AraC-like DNA-binding protein